MIPLYSGNSAYCFSNSLRMCLHAAGMLDLPEIGLIECMTGMPFGAWFRPGDAPVFFPDSRDPDEGLDRAIATMGWTCTTWRGEDVDRARAAFLDVIDGGPVLLGPLDMGYLTYDPSHTHKRGGDHFVVALKRDGDMVQVHDPQLFPFATIPLVDLLDAWRATHLGYARCAYSMRHNFRQERGVSRNEMLQTTLATARTGICREPGGRVVYGPQAFALAADHIEGGPHPELAAMMRFFLLTLGARRSHDAAIFFEEAGQTEAARLTLRKAELFGSAQYRVARQDWPGIAAVFRALGNVEAQLVAICSMDAQRSAT